MSQAVKEAMEEAEEQARTRGQLALSDWLGEGQLEVEERVEVSALEALLEEVNYFFGGMFCLVSC